MSFSVFPFFTSFSSEAWESRETRHVILGRPLFLRHSRTSSFFTSFSSEAWESRESDARTLNFPRSPKSKISRMTVQGDISGMTVLKTRHVLLAPSPFSPSFSYVLFFYVILKRSLGISRNKARHSRAFSFFPSFSDAVRESRETSPVTRINVKYFVRPEKPARAN